MRRFIGSLPVVALFMCGCNGEGVDRHPTAPISPPPHLNRYTVATIGDIVDTVVTADDVPCDFGYYCKYFQVTVPGSGTFEVGLTHAPGRIFSPPMTPIDMWVSGPGGPPAWMDVEGFVRTRAIQGGTYSIAVVSYEMPGVAFQLRFSLLP